MLNTCDLYATSRKYERQKIIFKKLHVFWGIYFCQGQIHSVYIIVTCYVMNFNKCEVMAHIQSSLSQIYVALLCVMCLVLLLLGVA